MNFPQVELHPVEGITRIQNVHKNEPGVLGEINGIISKYGANIQGQFDPTDENIGYLVVDIENMKSEKLVDEIQKSSRSLRTRVIF